MRLLCAEQIDKEHACSPELSSQSWLCYLSSVFPLIVLSWLIIYNSIKYLTYLLKYIPISLVLNEWRIAVRFPESFLNRSFLGISKNMGDAYSFCSLEISALTLSLCEYSREIFFPFYWEFLSFMLPILSYSTVFGKKHCTESRRSDVSFILCFNHKETLKKKSYSKYMCNNVTGKDEWLLHI